MRSRPADLSDADVGKALSAWGIEAVALDYAPVGFGDHHWRAVGADDRRWFVTVAEPAAKAHPGADGGAADGVRSPARDDEGLAALRRAMDCARALRDGGMAAVVAPERTAAGETVVPVGAQYAVSVFPHVEGETGRFGDEPDVAARRAAIALLAELHAVPAPACAPRIAWQPPARAVLDRALAAVGEPWRDGPYAEPARAALRDAAPGVRAALARFDAQVAAAAAARSALVVTHGEPHPGNLLALPGGRLRLVDWDTVGLSAPERDLWHVVRDGGDVDLYERLSGLRPRGELLDLFRLRWDLGDAGELLGWFRAPHGDGGDLADGWRELRALLRRLSAGGAGAGAAGAAR